ARSSPRRFPASARAGQGWWGRPRPRPQSRCGRGGAAPSPSANPTQRPRLARACGIDQDRVMHDAAEFLRTLTIVLATAAVTTVVFQRLRQPVVLGYIIAGLIIGPHVPIPLVADVEVVETLSELGVILLMFSLGLEFSLAKLVRVGPTAGVTAVIQSAIMAWLGFMVGRAFG